MFNIQEDIQSDIFITQFILFKQAKRIFAQVLSLRFVVHIKSSTCRNIRNLLMKRISKLKGLLQQVDSLTFQ